MIDIVERLRYHSESQVTGKLQLTNPDGPEAAAEIERLRAASQWQPIETAPKDGTWVLLLWPMTRTNVMVSGKYYISARDFEEMWLSQPSVESTHEPTHWMPLPSPPTQDGGG